MTYQPTIAELNDLLRNTFITGWIMLSDGIKSLPEHVRVDVITRVRTFDEFSTDNDPHGEHDFGAFEHPSAGKVFWKIDYFDLEGGRHSPDPSNPEVTRRLLTIMLAHEY